MWTAWDLVRGATELAGVLDSAGRRHRSGGEPRRPRPLRQLVPAGRGRSRTRTRMRASTGSRGRAAAFNHYLFDLNRDWAWATQVETQARLATWSAGTRRSTWTSTRWATPRTTSSSRRRRRSTRCTRRTSSTGASTSAPPTRARSTNMAGRTTRARASTCSIPGYGDSWPSLLGAIGMTYEQAGSGRAGLAIRQPDGQLLTLRAARDAAPYVGQRHTARRGCAVGELLADFARFHQTMGEGLPDILIVPSGDGRSGAARAAAATGHPRGAGDACVPCRRRAAFRLREPPRVPGGTLPVRARQPRGRLASTLLQPETVLDATHSYDISAWSLPFAYGVEAHSVPDAPDAGWAAAATGAPGRGGARRGMRSACSRNRASTTGPSSSDTSRTAAACACWTSHSPSTDAAGPPAHSSSSARAWMTSSTRFVRRACTRSRRRSTPVAPRRATIWVPAARTTSSCRGRTHRRRRRLCHVTRRTLVLPRADAAG
jgi:hypothetical protein